MHKTYKTHTYTYSSYHCGSEVPSPFTELPTLHCSKTCATGVDQICPLRIRLRLA